MFPTIIIRDHNLLTVALPSAAVEFKGQRERGVRESKPSEILQDRAISGAAQVLSLDRSLSPLP